MLKTVGFPSTRTGDQTIVAGNLVIGTAGKGIDFSADPATAGMTSELLDDYEEGTYTPTLVPSTSGTITLLTAISTLSYTKIGRLVTVTGLIQVDSSSSPVGSFVTLSLPFTINGTGYIGRTVGGVVTRFGGANSGLLNIGAEGSPNMPIYIDASTVVSTRQFSISISFITA